MAPDCNTSLIPHNLRDLKEDLGMDTTDTHTFPIADYVIIQQCNPPCNDCEFIKVSNKDALKMSLKEEKDKNEKYRERLNDVLKKYGRSLRLIERQKSKIEKLTHRLLVEQHTTVDPNSNQYKIITSDDYNVIQSSSDSLEEDDDLVLFRQAPRLEIISE